MPCDQDSAWPSKALANRQHANRFFSRIVTFLMVGGLLLFSDIANAQNHNDPRDLLLHARENILDTIKRLPRYLCTQTVDRTRYEPANLESGIGSVLRTHSCDDTIAEARRSTHSRRLSSSDRLRLDVAVSHSVPGMESEMYSWAGEDRFGDRDLFEFVRDGSISTGSFSSMLAAIFGSTVAKFSYHGHSDMDGRFLAEFGFRVAQEESSYTYVFGNSPGQQAPMAYDGKIFIDPETLDLVRLVIRTDELAAETGACELTQTLDYGRMRLNDADFLLPTEARVSVLHYDGTEAENRIQYSACREFRSKSVLRFPPFEEGEVQASAGHVPASPLLLPPGLSFKVVFTDPIDPASAAAGDPVRGRLKTAIRDRSSNVLVPEGTSVTGRIMSIRHYYEPSRPPIADKPNADSDAGWVTLIGPWVPKSESRNINPRQPSLVLKMRLEKLDIGGTSRIIKVAFDSGHRRFVNPRRQLSQRLEIGSLDPSQDSNTGSFEFWETHPVVNSGLESKWVTLAP